MAFIQIPPGVDFRRRRGPQLDDTPFANPDDADPMPGLPDLRPNQPIPLAAPAGYEAPTSAPPPYRQNQTRSAELEEAKSAFLQKPRSRKAAALQGLVKGLLQGLSSGDLGAGIGGAAAGALAGGINPKRQREQEFYTQVAPKIAQRWGMEDADRAAQIGAEDRELNRAYKTAQIGEINRRELPRPQRPSQPHWEATGPSGELKDLNAPENKGKVFTRYQRPQLVKPPTSAELSIDPDSGLSVEEMADASYNERGGDTYVYNHLPERTRRVLEAESGTVSPTEVSAARSEYQSAIDRQRRADLTYTRGHIRAKRLGAPRFRPRDASQPAANPGGITRLRSDFNSAKFPGMKFDDAPAQGGTPARPNQQPPRAQISAAEPAELAELRRSAENAWRIYQDPNERRGALERISQGNDPLALAWEKITGGEDPRIGRLRQAAEDAQRLYDEALAEYQQRFGGRGKKR